MYELNYLTLLAAAIANMVIGSLWYGPVFGTYWMKLAGLTPEGMKAMALKPWQAMIGGAITALLISWALIEISWAFGFSGIQGAMSLAFLVWVGFTAVTLAEPFLWEGKPFMLFVLNAARSAVTLAAMALIVVLWPW